MPESRYAVVLRRRRPPPSRWWVTPSTAIAPRSSSRRCAASGSPSAPSRWARCSGDDLALLAEGAREHVDVVATSDVVRDRDAGREGLVVGVGVHEEQPRGTRRSGSSPSSSPVTGPPRCRRTRRRHRRRCWPTGCGRRTRRCRARGARRGRCRPRRASSDWSMSAQAFSRAVRSAIVLDLGHAGVEVGVVPVAVVASRAGLGDVDRAVEQRAAGSSRPRPTRAPSSTRTRRPRRPSSGSLIAVK